MMKNRKCCLYTMKNINGDVLYIGISVKPISRLLSHFKEKEWVEDISDIKVEWYETEKEALKEESLRVWGLNPKYNKALNDIKNNLNKGSRLKDQCKTVFSKLCWDAVSSNGGINYLFKKYTDRGFDYEHLAYFLKKGVVPHRPYITSRQRSVMIFLSLLSDDVFFAITSLRPDLKDDLRPDVINWER